MTYRVHALSLMIFTIMKSFTKDSTSSVERGCGAWHHFFQKERDGKKQNKLGRAFKGRWQQGVNSSIRIFASACSALDQLKNPLFSFLYQVVISYCQLRLVLAAHSLPIVNSVDPHSEILFNTAPGVRA